MIDNWGWLFGAAGALAAMFTALGSFGTWIWTGGGNAAVLAKDVREANAAAEAANKRAEAAEAQNIALLKQLHEHMIGDAASFAKLEAISAEAVRVAIAAEARLTAAMKDLADRIDNNTARLDKIIDRSDTRAPSPRAAPRRRTKT